MVKETGTGRLCCAGGVFMNCKANGSMMEVPGVTELYVPPAASDEGACMGAAFQVASESGCRVEGIRSYAELGPRYSNDDVRAILRNSGVAAEVPSDPIEAAAQALADGKTVGWFRGGVEAGARALGNRSILANPAIRGIKSHINASIKYREMWRPYCPSMTEEFAPEAMERSQSIPFMNIARSASRRIMTDAPDIVHVDGSMRPQTVSAAERPQFHELLERCGKYIGMPVLLNTSFNVRGKPIVCTPLDALATFYSTRLDLLVLEDIIVRKNGA
jgi:carbamoyltransferase